MFTLDVLLLVILFSIINQAVGQDYVKDRLKIDDLKDIDPLGALNNVLDTALTRASLRNWRPKKRCATRLLKITDSELMFSGTPRGDCSYCCPITHPNKYVKLYFSNARLRKNMVELKLSNAAGALHTAGLKNNAQTVIFFHGFTEHGLGPLPMKILDAYLTRPEERNIILVDWGELSPLPWYPQAVNSTRLVAKLLIDFIEYYNGTGELPISQLHLIGFSLGAHIAGFIGKGLRHKEKVPRITALDPARPLYPVEDANQRVNKDDAEFVDVIHTDGGKFGLPISLGYADFYPNGGVYFQPGCTTSYLAQNRTIEHFGTCSHLRAIDLYAESVRNPKAFPAYRCQIRCKRDRNTYMGFSASKRTAVGDYYLETNEQSPYGKFAND